MGFSDADVHEAELATAPPPGLFLHDRLFWLALAAIVAITPTLAVLPGVDLAPKWPVSIPFALAVLVYPPLEEVVYRAGLQAWLLRRWPPESGRLLSRANSVTAIMFAVTHLWFHPPLWALATALPALLFGAFFERHRQRLGAPIILHGACNAAYFGLLG
ncbi:MAG: JDVT-CTERM system glutamic-type intramembrane protease [Nitrococcus sp.]|nr:JDVT-CTERM system glutamic-type intramembrane protease [Nitrococcus sp.]